MKISDYQRSYVCLVYEVVRRPHIKLWEYNQCDYLILEFTRDLSVCICTSIIEIFLN